MQIALLRLSLFVLACCFCSVCPISDPEFPSRTCAAVSLARLLLLLLLVLLLLLLLQSIGCRVAGRQHPSCLPHTPQGKMAGVSLLQRRRDGIFF